ncbi:MAG TPA: hypothetical protein VEI27_02555, partial [Dehalococcoidales bacterium]|nr:hypothetical protein [Dehalococcoidales bacterium]
GWTVPDVLLSGNHAQIADWRKKQSLVRTAERRPDLIGKIKLSAEEKKIIKAHRSTVSTGVEGNE